MAQSVLGNNEEKVTTQVGADVKSDKSDKNSGKERHDGSEELVGKEPKLQRRLKGRHLQMIAIGTP